MYIEGLVVLYPEGTLFLYRQGRVESGMPSGASFIATVHRVEFTTK
jgi:hypothetical protein